MENGDLDFLRENEEVISRLEFNYITCFFDIIFILLSIVFISAENTSFFGWILFITFSINLISNLINLKHYKLILTNMRLIGKIGWLSTTNLDAPINKINDVFYKQSLNGKLFNYSTVIISTSSSKYIYKYAKNVEEFKNNLNDIIHQQEKYKPEIYTAKEDLDNYEKIKKLKELLDNQAITEEEYLREKQKLI